MPFTAELLLFLLCALRAMWHQPLNSDIGSQVKLRQATHQLGPWAATDDVQH